ncbi:hypothetical protein T05_2235 [Trichinella murrelli]|uniref:Uncharacterized protein n=1 Tax=Trichinella murrelli TaxID=144512 RepID=A0A0V0UCU2_9BILA|nr:hypothetical protein T05_2235 [Trichinella murrelli]
MPEEDCSIIPFQPFHPTMLLPFGVCERTNHHRQSINADIINNW